MLKPFFPLLPPSHLSSQDGVEAEPLCAVTIGQAVLTNLEALPGRMELAFPLTLISSTVSPVERCYWVWVQ